MRSVVTISIPEPCSEKWTAMTAVDDLHRHCKACDRVLTDFTQMTDTELILWLKHSKGKICERFAPHQLSHPFTLPLTPVKQKYALNALWLLSLSWFAVETKAQQPTEIIKSKPNVSIQVNTNRGDTLPVKVNFPPVIKGTVLDKTLNEPIIAILIQLKADGVITSTGCVTDLDGNFELHIPENLRNKVLTLTFSGIAYNYKEQEYKLGNPPVNFTGKEIKLENVYMEEDPNVAPSFIGIVDDTSPKAMESRDRHSIWSKARLAFGFGKR